PSTGCSDAPTLALIAHAAPDATIAAPHKRARYPAPAGADPIRFPSAFRSNRNSTQPLTPAEAVSPATPHFGSIPSRGGSGMAHRYPSTVVSATRMVANRSGVRGAFNA